MTSDVNHSTPNRDYTDAEVARHEAEGRGSAMGYAAHYDEVTYRCADCKKSQVVRRGVPHCGEKPMQIERRINP